MLIVIGLGNPGRKYESTRHNVGFMVVDRLAARLGVGSFRREETYLVAEIEYRSEPLVLCKPTTYMNLSGIAVQKILEAAGTEPARLLVVYDDVALPLGRLRLRLRGSSGGHNGLESILDAVSVDSVPRLRCGIGATENEISMLDYVLQEFRPEEREEAARMAERATDAILSIIEVGFDKAMNLYNSLSPQNQDSD